jgi:hypothetical protein
MIVLMNLRGFPENTDRRLSEIRKILMKIMITIKKK